jgi:hypothetical protein
MRIICIISRCLSIHCLFHFLLFLVFLVFFFFLLLCFIVNILELLFNIFWLGKGGVKPWAKLEDLRKHEEHTTHKVGLVIGADLQDSLQEGLGTGHGRVILQGLIENVQEESVLGRGQKASIEKNFVEGAIISVRDVLTHCRNLVQESKSLYCGVEGRLVDNLEE